MPPSDRWDIISGGGGAWNTLSGEQSSSVIEGTRSFKFQKEAFNTGSLIYKLKSSYGLAGKNWARHRGIFRSVNAGSVGGAFAFGVLLNASHQGYWLAFDTDNFSGDTTAYIIKGDIAVANDLAGAGVNLLTSVSLGTNIFSPQVDHAFEILYDRNATTGLVTLTVRHGLMGSITPDFTDVFYNLAQVAQVTDSTYSSGTVGFGATSLSNGNIYTFNFDIVETWIQTEA